MEAIETTEDGIDIYDADRGIGTFKYPNGKEYVIETIGWVCGIIYHDGCEWLYAKNALASNHEYRCREDEKPTLVETKEQALEHLRKFKKWDKCPRFVRPYLYEHPKRT